MPPRRRSAVFAEIDTPTCPPANDRRAQAALADFAILVTYIDAHTPLGQDVAIAEAGPANIENTSDDQSLPQALGHAAVADTTVIDPDVDAATDNAEQGEDQPLGSSEATAVEAQEAGPFITILDFTDIFERYQAPITNFILRMVGNREEAYDLAQDVFVKAFRGLGGGARIQAGAFPSWLYRIASNTATDALRRRRVVKWLPLSLFNEDRGIGVGMPDGKSTEQSRDAQAFDTAVAGSGSINAYNGGRFDELIATHDIVQRVLSRLRPKYREALLMYEHEGFSVQEIADLLQATPSTIKMRLMRGRDQFIALYQQETGEHSEQASEQRQSKKTSKQAAPVLVAV